MLTERQYGSNQTLFHYIVEPQHEGERLDSFVKSHLGRQSRELVKKKILLGEITIHGRPHPHRPATRIHAGERITMVIERDRKASEWDMEHWDGQQLSIESGPTTVYEDNDLLIVSKPPFMTVHPTGRHFFNCVTVHYEYIYQQTIHTIHRLDRETSGLLMLGKNSQMSNLMASAFREHQVRKCYFLAAVKDPDRSMLPSFPFWAQERMDFDDPSRRVFMKAFPPESTEGKVALTYYELLAENEDYLLALAYPFTGRQHQIRLHAAFHHFPLVGDKIYNGDPDIFIRYKDKKSVAADFAKLEIPRHALHAFALAFPYNGQQKIVLDQLPSDLCEWIKERFPSLETSHLAEKMNVQVHTFFQEHQKEWQNYQLHLHSELIEEEDGEE